MSKLLTAFPSTHLVGKGSVKRWRCCCGTSSSTASWQKRLETPFVFPDLQQKLIISYTWKTGVSLSFNDNIVLKIFYVIVILWTFFWSTMISNLSWVILRWSLSSACRRLFSASLWHCGPKSSPCSATSPAACPLQPTLSSLPLTACRAFPLVSVNTRVCFSEQ